MNAFIFTEDNNLHITKPNGLRFQFENVDKPNLGFEYDVVIYDKEEFKILNYDDSKSFDEQERQPLEGSDRDSIENYIDNSEPPHGVSLNNQIVDDVYGHAQQLIGEMADTQRFRDIYDATYAGREGSNHPFRSDARRVLEYADSVYVCLVQVTEEIQATREDHLKGTEENISLIPTPFDSNALT